MPLLQFGESNVGKEPPEPMLLVLLLENVKYLSLPNDLFENVSFGSYGYEGRSLFA